MGKVNGFEELNVWQKSILLSKEIYVLTQNQSFEKDFGLKDQIRRASVSVSSNIAEGFERGSDKDFLKFLYYSKGSVAEVRSQLYIAQSLNYINKEEFGQAQNLSIEISKMLQKFIEYLKSNANA